ncbi:MAG: hypothetical protein JOS17DRAFT_598524 [Linnemannia elongata]|nr:MAG: hypothetical protein JOS17DRAFT_598524 [Linnemannia elongata]
MVATFNSSRSIDGGSSWSAKSWSALLIHGGTGLKLVNASESPLPLRSCRLRKSTKAMIAETTTTPAMAPPITGPLLFVVSNSGGVYPVSGGWVDDARGAGVFVLGTSMVTVVVIVGTPIITVVTMVVVVVVVGPGMALRIVNKAE